MSQESNLNQTKPEVGAPNDPHQSGPPLQGTVGADPTVTARKKDDSPELQQASPSDSSTASEPSLSAASDCLEAGGSGQLPPTELSVVREPGEEDREENQEGTSSNAATANSPCSTGEDPFTPTDDEKPIDRVVLDSLDERLARGSFSDPSDHYRDNVEDCAPEIYQPASKLDLLRRDDTIQVFRVKWNGSQPVLTTAVSPRGRIYDVPSLPRKIYESLILPTDVTKVPSAREAFTAVSNFLRRCSFLSDSQRELVAYWVIATWFSDVLDFVPRLTLTGSRYAANLLFDSLRAVCRRAIRLSAFTPAILKHVQMPDAVPTLLIHQTKLSKGAAELMDTSDYNGYFSVCAGELCEFRFVKAVYSGQEFNPKYMADGLYIHLNANVSVPDRSAPLEALVEHLQNQLFTYRCFNLQRVSFPELKPDELLPQFAWIVQHLGAVICADSELQQHLAQLLREQDEPTRAERATGAEATVARAVVVLCHHGEAQSYVRDVAAVANQVSIELGESRKLSNESVGHLLKKLGLTTRRLGSEGRGLILDKSTQLRAHQLSVEYDVLPDTPECGHCRDLQLQGCEDVM